jgi:GR25 family glycosyltransferase involved in LPS biosynthesis
MTGQELLLDKNKSVYKLRDLPHIYWLNLDADAERCEYMENQFKYWEIENHTRISGYDGREDDVSCHLKGKIPDNVSQKELGCCMSHLKAIKKFYEETDDEYCLIMEDDAVLDIARYWNFTWHEFFSLLPYDWDCVQLTTITTGDIHVKLHLKFINDFSAAVYLISRHHAAKIIKNHVRGDKYKLDQGVKPRAVSEDTILETGKTYSIPLFLYNLKFNSTIHPEHIHVFHQGPYNALLNYWQQSGAGIDIKDYMDYDPYLGRITENSAAQRQQETENPTS